MVKSPFLYVLLSSGICCIVYGGPASYTREELLIKAREQKSKIESIEYTFANTLLTDHLEEKERKRLETTGLIAYEWAEIGQKGFKKYMNHKFHIDSEAKSGFGEERLTYDGKFGSRYFPKEAVADVKKDAYKKIYTNDHYYARMLMQEPTGTDLVAVLSDCSLIGILDCEKTTVRPGTEMIEGHDCHVVDIKIEENVVSTVYIDTERGFLPIKFMQYGSVNGKDGELVTEIILSDIRKFDGDLWFPLQINRMAMMRKKRGDSEAESGWFPLKDVLRIQEDGNGKPLLQINHDVPDSKFKPNFAVRTQVNDSVMGTSYLVGGVNSKDLDRFTNDRIKMAKEDNLPIDQFASQYVGKQAGEDELVDDEQNIVNDGSKATNDIENPKELRTGKNNTLYIIGVVIIIVLIIIIMGKNRRGSIK